MAGIVANLVDIGRDLVGDLVVLLQIDRQHDTFGLRADFLQRGRILVVVDGDAQDAGAGSRELMRLLYGLIAIGSARRAHRLHDDRRIASDHRSTDIDLACLATLTLLHALLPVPLRLQNCPLSFCPSPSYGEGTASSPG